MASTTTTTTITLVGFENVTKGEVKNNEWVGVGIFDTLMYAANKNIEIQFNKGRIVGKEYAEAYTNVMNTIIAQSIQYYLQKDTQDAQTDDIRAGTAVKEQQEKNLYTEQVKLDKEVAALRLDNVLKNVEAGRTSTDATEIAKWGVYTPKYVKS